MNLRGGWYTAAELAELKLPGLPTSKRKINELAGERAWHCRTDAAGNALARNRAGRGGGLEYHTACLPPAAASALVALQEAEPANDDAAPNAPSQLWSWFDGQADKVKADARERLAAVMKVSELVELTGLTRSAAVSMAASEHGVSVGSVWNWLKLLDGVDRVNWLPALAPRRAGGAPEADIDPGAWQFLRSDYLRPSAPTFASCYQRLLNDYAKPRGLSLPSQKTLQRRLEKETPRALIVYKRQGADALRGTIPYQRRSVADFHALELVNIDGHLWDVFVRWPDGHIARPMMVAIQDVYSRKILAWRIGQTESAVLTRLAFADVFKNYGIPGGCLMDNGRAFASKWITGGVASRFRFKIQAEEPLGLLPNLGIQNHWAKPFRGSSKPIERAFRDLCQNVAKHPAFEGAYAGNNTMSKPENYGTAAVDLERFVTIASHGIRAHNAKMGRRTETARGTSFNDVFEESYKRSPIAKAGPEQMRLALLAPQTVSADRKTGAIRLFENTYHCDALDAFAGQRLVVRFDPDNLHDDVYLYTLDGRFVAQAPVQEATGFLDAGAAKVRAKQESDLRRKAREMEEMQDLLTAAQLADQISYEDDDDSHLNPSVIRPVRPQHARGQALARKVQPDLISRPGFDVDQLAPIEKPMPALRLVTE